MALRFLLLLLSIFYLKFPVLAQSNVIKFEKSGSQEGLSYNNVSCALQDSKGFLWFGTKDGLNKYDGYKFTVFKKSFGNKNSLTSNDIKCLLEDEEGKIWIGTWQGGLNCYDPRKETFEHYTHSSDSPSSISSDDIKCLYKDKKGNIWIGTGAHGLNLFDKKTGTFTRFTNHKETNFSISDNSITCIYEDSKGTLWIGTKEGGLNKLDTKTGKFHHFKNIPGHPSSLSHNYIQFIHEDKSGKFWIGTYGGGLNLFDARRQEFKRINLKSETKEKKEVFNVLLSILEDKSGKFWIGTENSGLLLFDPETETVQLFQNTLEEITSISSNTINFLLKDNKGNIWVCTSDGGVNKINIDAAKFTHYKQSKSPNGLSNNIVTSFYEDSNENIWIGTDGGGVNLFNVKNKSFTYLRHKEGEINSLSDDNVLSICEDESGNLWFGTWGNGVTVYNPYKNTYRHFLNDKNKPGSLSSNYAFYLLKDSRSRIWVATYGGGLNLYDPQTESFIQYRHNEKNKTSISSDLLICLFEDRNGNIWIGTEGSGFDLFDEEKGTFIHFQKTKSPEGLSNNYVGGIFEDRNGFLWISTNFGLNKFDPKSRTITEKFFVEDGLPADLISKILEDKRGNLWIGTSNGISKYNPLTKQFKNLSLADGLQGTEFKSAFASRRGYFYFGGRNGFNEFHPEQIEATNFDPPVVFTNLQVFNKEVKIGSNDEYTLKKGISFADEVILSHKASVFSVEFASLNFTSSEKKQYLYKLENFDDRWRNLGTRNSLTYTNLNPGTYFLKVKGLKNDGTWSATIAQLKITILPPFWKTWWFHLLVFTVISGMIMTAYYIRTSSIRKQNVLLEKEVAKRTADLTEANYSLSERNEEIKLQNEQLDKFNHEIQRQADKIFKQQEHIVNQNTKLEKSVLELEKSNHTKDKFFSILAHDLKNPIAALSGISGLLVKKVNQLDKEKIEEYVKDINNSSNAVYKLLINLLDWARSQTHNINCCPEPVYLHSMVMEIVAVLEQQVRNKSISLQANLERSHAVFVDRAMFETCLRNIIGNCIKFTERQGHISIVSEETEEEIAITVSDTGIGMSREQIDNLFKIEKHKSAKGTAGESGTGLGLIISKEFIELNKGSLSITSAPGKGSTFEIILPKAYGDIPNPTNTDLEDNLLSTKETAGYQKPDKEKIRSLKGKHLLIVDDNNEIRSYLKFLLSDVFEIIEASNGAEGLKMANEHQPELVITDMVMPEMDGVEFCTKIKSQVETSHISVILLTAQKENEDLLSGYEAGADFYLTKPIHEPLLFQVIANSLTKKEKVRLKLSQIEIISPEELGINKLDEEFLRKIIEFIEANISDHDLDHRKLSELTAMSRTLLYSKIKSLTGLGVHDFIKSVRVKKGLKLLLDGKMNINQIAYEVGFNTPSYFSKSFIKQYGVAPKEYVMRIRNER